MDVPLAPVEVKLGDGMFLSYPLIFVNLCYNLRLRRVTGTGSYSHVLFDNLKFGITTRNQPLPLRRFSKFSYHSIPLTTGYISAKICFGRAMFGLRLRPSLKISPKLTKTNENSERAACAASAL